MKITRVYGAKSEVIRRIHEEVRELEESRLARPRRTSDSWISKSTMSSRIVWHVKSLRALRWCK